MKIAIINKSDSTGGAAVVSFRLMEAFRRIGVDAGMVVVEKLTDSPFVEVARPGWRYKFAFLAERLKIFIANGFNRSTLFKIDIASDGGGILRSKLVREADVVMLNWVNQGMVSLKDVKRLSNAGKRIIWTMHDMWCFTGICHHSGECEHFQEECKDCWLLKGGLYKNLAFSTQKHKKRLYSERNIDFVAVSSWLAKRAAFSSLFDKKSPTVIPNAFHFDNKEFSFKNRENKGGENRTIKILFGAARLDDTVKGLPILVETTKILAESYPEISDRLELVTFGEAKDPSSLDGIGISHRHLGRISGKEALRAVYDAGDIVVSTSLYETLPGTLVEGQVYGCVPVAFPRGGQSDIIDHLSTGYLASWDDDIHRAATNIAEGIIWAVGEIADPARQERICRRMYESAYSKFAEEEVAKKYLRMLKPEPGRQFEC